jgi:hypothetical protein
MHPSQRPATQQQRRVRDYVGNADAYAMFNLLTGPQLLDRVEALLPDHRERLFPPTETLSNGPSTRSLRISSRTLCICS